MAGAAIAPAALSVAPPAIARRLPGASVWGHYGVATATISRVHDQLIAAHGEDAILGYLAPNEFVDAVLKEVGYRLEDRLALPFLKWRRAPITRDPSQTSARFMDLIAIIDGHVPVYYPLEYRYNPGPTESR